ncbi:MAG: hypothetical protein ACTJG4_13995 [Vreelandella alkaliphila]|uniref:hypothetical protein n=1 Tax=Halomonadaceae TaxID=28256 RepID=UPI000E7DAD00|nr:MULTISPECIES: hypothetical protein [unclassified Halomonas]HBP40287.1 hypothetical protein [Halomonas sp.]HBS84606.1 hypothetical protein [Halomonas campaniensis]
MLKILKCFSREEIDPSGYVYYARFQEFGVKFYVIGFSKEESLEKHLTEYENGEGECIDKIFFFTFRSDGWDVCQRMFDILKKKRSFRRYGKEPSLPFYGKDQSNVFAYDVLGLDAELYKLSKEAEASRQDAGFGCLVIFLGLVLIPFTAGVSIILIIVFIGFVAMHPYLTKHAKEIEGKAAPELPPKLQGLVDALVSKRDFQ